MSSPPVKRKLAAILAADAVGYSRMMAADEEDTLRILAAHRAVIDGIIQFHEGRIVNTAGDSVLAEFASPTQAVRCAVEIQDALKTRNDALPEGRRMQFRIGVNLGDVMVKGEDLLGDGVNVAARLEGISEPGNITVSSSVYDQIAGKLDLGFVDLGEQALKNIDRPVRAYRIDREGRRVRAARKPRPKRSAWILAGAVAIAAAGALAWYAAQVRSAREAEAAHAKADAEVAKARAEAEEAKKEAAAASDTAAAARRALEEQRAAEVRAKAQAELAAAHAEAEAARRKAQEALAEAQAKRAREESRSAQVEAQLRKTEAELAAAAEARRATEAKAKAPPAAKSYAGAWEASLSCTVEGRGARTFPMQVAVNDNRFELRKGTAGQPGWLQLSGAVQSDGALRFAGDGLSSLQRSYGKPFPAVIDGKFSGERYAGRGRVGIGDCTLALARASGSSAAAATPAAAAPQWSGQFSCEAFRKLPAQTFGAAVSASGVQFEVHRGRVGQPGSLHLSGARQPDGTLRLAGVRLQPGTGESHPSEFDGRFTGERYEARGHIGQRACTLAIDRH